MGRSQLALPRHQLKVLGDAGWTGSASNTYGPGAGLFYEGSWAGMSGAPVFDLAFQTFVTRNGSTPPPTSTGGDPGRPGGSSPLPLFLALMAAVPVVGLLLAKRFEVATRR